MKKIVGLVLSVVIFLIFISSVYNSKRDYYSKKIEFYKSNFSGEIVEIIITRGTKVYYLSNQNENFFYLEHYKGIELGKGDVLRKINDKIQVFKRNAKNEYVETGSGESLKPEESYFDFFF